MENGTQHVAGRDAGLPTTEVSIYRARPDRQQQRRTFVSIGCALMLAILAWIAFDQWRQVQSGAPTTFAMISLCAVIFATLWIVHNRWSRGLERAAITIDESNRCVVLQQMPFARWLLDLAPKTCAVIAFEDIHSVERIRRRQADLVVVTCADGKFCFSDEFSRYLFLEHRLSEIAGETPTPPIIRSPNVQYILIGLGALAIVAAVIVVAAVL